MSRTYEDGYAHGKSDGKADGLIEAMRRLSAVGLHDARCPEPDEACNCGIDAAIQQAPPVALRVLLPAEPGCGYYYPGVGGMGDGDCNQPQVAHADNALGHGYEP